MQVAYSLGRVGVRERWRGKEVEAGDAIVSSMQADARHAAAQQADAGNEDTTCSTER